MLSSIDHTHLCPYLTPVWRCGRKPLYRIPTDKPYILRLPDEILHEIFATTKLGGPLGTGWGEWTPWRKQNKALLTLSLCCRRFNRIVEPILYGDIFGGTTDLLGQTKGPKFDKLCRTLQTRPELGQMCKEIYMENNAHPSIPDAQRGQPETYLTETVEVISALPNVRKLKFNGSFSEWPLLPQAVRHMQLIEDLSLIGDEYWPINHLVDKPGFPNLRTLHLSPIYGNKNFGHNNTPPMEEEITPAKKKHTSFIKSIYICGFRCHPNDVKELLTWPTELEELGLVHFEPYYQAVSVLYSTQILRELFSIHKDTMRRIKFTWQNGEPSELDFSDFPLLESIEMPWLSLPSSAAEASTKLCGPSLTSLTLDFDCEDQQHQIWADFDQQAFDYLLEFAKLADHGRKSLRVVKIWRGGTEAQHLLWPTKASNTRMEHVAECYVSWNLMERLEYEMALRDIKFDYSIPELRVDEAIDYIYATEEKWKEERRKEEVGQRKITEFFAEVGQKKITEFFAVEVN